MSRQLLINNANAVPAAAAGTTSPDEVAAGTIAAFDADNFAGGTLDFSDTQQVGKNVVFVQGAKAGEEPLMSPVFAVDDIKPDQLHERAYIAPVAQVTTVTAETGTGFAYIRVVQTNAGFKPHNRITAEVKLDDKTADEIATALANAINAQSPNFVTATTSTADLIITADAGASFETSTDEAASGWTVAATTTPNFGTGTSEMLKNMEEIAYGGNYLNRIYLPITPPSYVVDGETYDLFTIEIPTNTTPNISKSNKYHELTIAVQATASGISLPIFFGHEPEVA